MIYVGIAGWSLSKQFFEHFPGEGSHLERYAHRFSTVEINSSFYQDHKPLTYVKWAAAVPKDFKFAVKLSRVFTHENRLQIDNLKLQDVLSGIQELGSKLGSILVQLPPSLNFNPTTAEHFFKEIRRSYQGPLVLEPRHYTWTMDEARILLKQFSVSKVLADPEPCPTDRGFYLPEIFYYRLHGSPEMYKSNYSDKFLEKLYEELIGLNTKHKNVWCVFDNTALGYATLNGLYLMKKVNEYSSKLKETNPKLDPHQKPIVKPDLHV